MSDVSESLRSLTKTERMSELLFYAQIAHLLIFSQKTSDSLRKLMSEFPALVLTLFTTLWDQLGVFTLFTTLWDQLGIFTLFTTLWDQLEVFFGKFYILFLFLRNVRFAHSLFFNE